MVLFDRWVLFMRALRLGWRLLIVDVDGPAGVGSNNCAQQSISSDIGLVYSQIGQLEWDKV